MLFTLLGTVTANTPSEDMTEEMAATSEDLAMGNLVVTLVIIKNQMGAIFEMERN